MLGRDHNRGAGASTANNRRKGSHAPTTTDNNRRRGAEVPAPTTTDNNRRRGAEAPAPTATDNNRRRGAGAPTPTPKLRLLTSNIDYGAQDYNISSIIDLIHDTKADVVVILEALTNNDKPQVDASQVIADNLGWNHVLFKSNESAIVSRLPMVKIPKKDAVIVNMTNKNSTVDPICIIPVHYSDYPYQPFQASNIEYCYDTCQKLCLETEAEYISEANRARGKNSDDTLHMARSIMKTMPVIITGDFNEPSHLDWTSKAAKAGLCPRKIRYPTSLKFRKSGFMDAYRLVHPDEVKYPGHTWPTVDPGYGDIKDRIDFVYVSGDFEVLTCDVKVTPSDHLSVITQLGRGSRGSRAPTADLNQ
jgi:exodeoxyribonuclease-3